MHSNNKENNESINIESWSSLSHVSYKFTVHLRNQPELELEYPRGPTMQNE